MPDHARLYPVDFARTLALFGMFAFHLTYDLALFGLIAPERPYSGFFWYLARIVAGSFIALAGLSLVLAHDTHRKPKAFWHRLIKIGLAALCVSIATYFAMPHAWVFFGILHAIALFSLLGYGLLGAPTWLWGGLALVLFTLPHLFQSPAFDGWLIWIGLGSYSPITADFEPVFPWFGAFLIGMIIGRVIAQPKLRQALTLNDRPLWRWLAWPGRHSLWIYLIHQPLLFGILLGLLRLGWIGQ